MKSVMYEIIPLAADLLMALRAGKDFTTAPVTV